MNKNTSTCSTTIFLWLKKARIFLDASMNNYVPTGKYALQAPPWYLFVYVVWSICICNVQSLT
jgi:hypothetical protein